jgi:hypothetical protein
MTMAMEPYLYEDEYAVLILGTTTSPGVITDITGHDRFKNWEKKKGLGTEGCTNSLHADDPGAFEVTFFLAGYAAEDGEGAISDFQNFENFAALIRGMTDGPIPTAMPIYHPDLARQGITEVSSGGIGRFQHDKLGGVYVKIRFVEYRPEKKKPPAKAKAVPGVRVGVTTIEKLDPLAARKAELQALRDRAANPAEDE